jgi:hypothetical protein
VVRHRRKDDINGQAMSILMIGTSFLYIGAILNPLQQLLRYINAHKIRNRMLYALAGAHAALLGAGIPLLICGRWCGGAVCAARGVGMGTEGRDCRG